MPKQAEFKNWRLRPIWSLEEGIQLLFGIEPVKDILQRLDYLEEQHVAPYRKIGQELRVRLDIGIRSIRAGELVFDSYCFDPVWASQFRPRRFLKWASKNGWEIPAELASLQESHASEDAGDDIGSADDAPVERASRKTESRLLVIQGVISGLGYDPLKIPKGGKQKIKSACCKHPKLFTDATFDMTWKVARKAELVKMADHDAFCRN